MSENVRVTPITDPRKLAIHNALCNTVPLMVADLIIATGGEAGPSDVISALANILGAALIDNVRPEHMDEALEANFSAIRGMVEQTLAEREAAKATLQ